MLGVSVLSAVLALGCDEGAGGPPPCVSDPECVAICDAACVPEAAISAVCDEFLQACVCECEGELQPRVAQERTYTDVPWRNRHVSGPT
jgi:hypothetical protein